MSNLIDRYAQPPPQAKMTTQHLGVAQIPPIQTHGSQELQRVPSPALNRVAKNLPEILVKIVNNIEFISQKEIINIRLDKTQCGVGNGDSNDTSENAIGDCLEQKGTTNKPIGCPN